MKIRKKELQILFTFLLCLFVWLIIVVANQHKLKENFYLVSGVVNKCDIGGKGFRGVVVYYTYTDKGKHHKDQARLDYRSISLNNCDRVLKGKTFSVVVSNSTFFPTSAILILPSDFRAFNLPFPDSLSWVLEYTKGRQAIER